MHIVFGILMAIIGAYFFISAVLKQEKFVYKFLVAKSRSLWKEHVHVFYTVVGLILMTVGLLWLCGLIF